jgi:hypothetical protein
MYVFIGYVLVVLSPEEFFYQIIEKYEGNITSHALHHITGSPSERDDFSYFYWKFSINFQQLTEIFWY